jgi:hypothetical protein
MKRPGINRAPPRSSVPTVIQPLGPQLASHRSCQKKATKFNRHVRAKLPAIFLVPLSEEGTFGFPEHCGALDPVVPAQLSPSAQHVPCCRPATARLPWWAVPILTTASPFSQPADVGRLVSLAGILCICLLLPHWDGCKSLVGSAYCLLSPPLVNLHPLRGWMFLDEMWLVRVCGGMAFGV